MRAVWQCWWLREWRDVNGGGGMCGALLVADAVAALALRYLRKREETRTLVTALKDSKLPGAARAAELLGRSGTRAALEDFD